MAKYLVQIIVLGTQAVGKAFARALRQEYQASQEAAARRRTANQGSSYGDNDDLKTSSENMRMGISVEEARNILNVSKEATPEEIQEKYATLFGLNGKENGGSFYIQSKIYRAKQRIDEEVKMKAEETTAKEQKSSASW